MPSLLFVWFLPLQFVPSLRLRHLKFHRWSGRVLLFLSIRNGRVGLHREWVTRMAAIALGAATTRPIIGVFFATRRLTGLTPQQFFEPAMWLGFVSTYVAGEV